MTEHALVLVIDRNLDVLALIEAVLDAAGHEVIASPRPQASHQRLRGRHPDVILLAAASPDPADVHPALGELAQGADHLPPIIVLLDAPAPGPVSNTQRIDGVDDDACDGTDQVGSGRWSPESWADGVEEVLAGPPTPLLLTQAVEDVLATIPSDAAIRRRFVQGSFAQGGRTGRADDTQPRSEPTTM